MRYSNLLESENWQYEDLGDMKRFILANCKPWIKESGMLDDPNMVVYRGSRTNFQNDYAGQVFTVRKDRRPVDSGIDATNLYNKRVEQERLAANRNNSLFVTGDYRTAKIYGNVRIIIPIGNFHYTWSEKISDWFRFYKEKSHWGEEDDFSLIGDDDTLPQAIKSGNEILIYCDRYVAVDTKLYSIVFG